MASTFSPSLRLELIGDGDQSGIWGQTTNNNLGTLIEQAVAGVITINIADANYTLTNFNGVADEARNAVIIITGTLSQQRNIIAPLAEKVFTFRNITTGGFPIQVIGSSGTGVIIPNGATTSIYCDGTNFFPLNTGAAGNFSVSGNLAVTGTTTLTGALSASTATFSGAISSVSPAFTGTPTAPTASAGTNTTQIATTAFVQNVTGALGTMSTQNANNVAITGGSITGITDLTVADGGTGTSSITANSVILGNGASPLSGNLVAPGASGNVLTSNGSTWTSAANAAPGVLANGTYGIGTTYSLSVTGTRPVILSMNYAGIQGGNTYVQVQFQWGFGSLTDSWTPIQSGVNFVVYPAPSITVMLTPPGTSSLQFRVDTISLGNQQFFVSAIQL
jgi:hypothetical protein